MSRILKMINTLFETNINIKTSILNLEGEIHWVSVLCIDNPEINVGILQDGRWVVEGKNGLYALNESKSHIKIMALLEKPLNSISDSITSVFKLSSFDVTVYDIFPFVDVVKAGLEQGSEYWAELAFKWFEDLPIEKKVYLKDSLVGITNAKWASQKLRHKAEREVEKLSKS